MDPVRHHKADHVTSEEDWQAEVWRQRTGDTAEVTGTGHFQRVSGTLKYTLGRAVLSLNWVDGEAVITE